MGPDKLEVEVDEELEEWFGHDFGQTDIVFHGGSLEHGPLEVLLVREPKEVLVGGLTPEEPRCRLDKGFVVGGEGAALLVVLPSVHGFFGRLVVPEELAPREQEVGGFLLLEILEAGEGMIPDHGGGPVLPVFRLVLLGPQGVFAGVLGAVEGRRVGEPFEEIVAHSPCGRGGEA